MKILFYNACSFWKSPLCELLDEAERLSRDGNDVFFVSCGGVMNCCDSNLLSNSLDCKVCRLSEKMTLPMLNKSVHILNLNEYKSNKQYHWNYKKAQDIKHIKYKDIPIGYGVMSTYITNTRNLNPLINDETRLFFDNCLSQAAALTDAFSRLIEDISPDRVCLFNGRFFEVSPIVQFSLKNSIPLDVYELLGGYGKLYYKTIFENTIAHDIDYITSQMTSAWDNSKKSLDERIKIGKSFFEKRRNGVTAGDKVYIKNQEKGLLPSKWNPKKTNIVIFNSSEDEFAAVGDKYEQYAMFPSQIEGIKSILKMCEQDKSIHFYLRIHPNLSDVSYKYHTELYELPRRYSNITVIPAKEAVSTYDLLDAANKVIVFGSTMGIESSYWGKPVILLAGALYRNLNVCHIPRSKEELYSCIIDERLEVLNKDMLPFYKYGFFFLDIGRSTRPASFDFFDYNRFTVTIGKKQFHGTNCQKLLGSSKLYAYFIAILRELSRIIKKNKYKMPLEEA